LSRQGKNAKPGPESTQFGYRGTQHSANISGRDRKLQFSPLHCIFGDIMHCKSVTDVHPAFKIFRHWHHPLIGSSFRTVAKTMKNNEVVYAVHLQILWCLVSWKGCLEKKMVELPEASAKTGLCRYLARSFQ
jgi:hypothetical protein